MNPVPPSPDDFVPASQAELARFLAENAGGARQALQPVGGRTALRYGGAVDGAPRLVSLARLDRVVDHPVRDMTITVEAGIRASDLQGLLAKESQQLPVDVPQSSRATLGGALACNVSGPRRYGCGTLRDYLIGVTAIDAGGRTFSAGGRVVKNVAGYDLCKLLVGSLGTLAVIVQCTLKLRPHPESFRFVWAPFDAFDDVDLVLERLVVSDARPVALDVLDPRAARELAAETRLPVASDRPVLLVAVQGSLREVEWQTQVVLDELRPFGPHDPTVLSDADSDALLRAVTDFPVETEDPVVFKATLRPSRTLEFVEAASRAGVAVSAHAGNGIVRGILPADAAALPRAKPLLDSLRRHVRDAQGRLVLLECPEDWKRELSPWGEADPSWEAMARLKRRLDPHGILNPGRFVEAAVADRSAG